MEELKKRFIIHSRSPNPWSLTLNQESEFFNLIEKELFTVPTETRDLFISAIKTTAFMVKTNQISNDGIIFEFINYILGSLFREMPEVYLILREQVGKKIPQKTAYDLCTLDSKFEKYFPDHKVEYEFMFESSLNVKKVS